MVLIAAIVAVLVIGIGLGLRYVPPSTSGGSGVSSQSTISNYSIRAENQTVVATYASTIASNASTSATVTSLSVTSSSNSSSAGGVFTYSPSSPVKVLSVQAFVNQTGSGNTTISFGVEFQNVGNSTIYVLGGRGGGLNAIILSGPARAEPSRGEKCEIIAATLSIDPGDNSTSFTPICSSPYTYVLLQPGTIGVELTLSWSTGRSSNVTDITAEFNLN